MRVWMLRPDVLRYLGQLSLPGSRGNARAGLVDLQQSRAGLSPLVTALLATPPHQRAARQDQPAEDRDAGEQRGRPVAQQR